MVRKTIIFDFDGTIADTLSACIHLVNNNSEKYGWRKIQDTEIEKLRGMTPFELIREFKIPFYKVPFLIKKFQLELYEAMDQVRIFPGMKNAIETLHKNGHRLGIITSNTEANVRRCLEAHKINSFDFIHNERSIFGKSHSIKNAIKAYKLTTENVVYIGDEVRDIQASHKSQIPSIAVTWGFNSKNLLKEHGPDYLVDSPSNLLDLLMKL